MFKGSMPALVTPFKNGELDVDTLKKLVEWHIAEGSNAIVPVGTTGESPTLSHEEHGRVIEIVVQTVAGRVPVIAGKRKRTIHRVNNIPRYVRIGIFIDRDPRQFRTVLEYLRHHDVHMLRWMTHRTGLKREFAFYNLSWHQCFDAPQAAPILQLLAQTFALDKKNAC